MTLSSGQNVMSSYVTYFDSVDFHIKSDVKFLTKTLQSVQFSSGLSAEGNYHHQKALRLLAWSRCFEGTQEPTRTEQNSADSSSITQLTGNVENQGTYETELGCITANLTSRSNRIICEDNNLKAGNPLSNQTTGTKVTISKGGNSRCFNSPYRSNRVFFIFHL